MVLQGKRDIGGRERDDGKLAHDLKQPRRSWSIVEVYRDAGISGAKGRDKRPGLDAMLKKALLARPQPQRRAASSPYLHGGQIAGAASGTFFRRNEGTFLSSHYLAAEIASPTVKHWGARLFLIRLMCLNAARHGVQLRHRRHPPVHPAD